MAASELPLPTFSTQYCTSTLNHFTAPKAAETVALGDHSWGEVASKWEVGDVVCSSRERGWGA